MLFRSHLYTLVATPLVVQLLHAPSAADPEVKEKSAYIQAAFLIGWALGGALVGWLLALFGYVPGAVQSAGTVHGITLMMSLVPAIPALLACLALHFYELDEPAVGRMGRDLAAARAAAGDGTVATS